MKKLFKGYSGPCFTCYYCAFTDFEDCESHWFCSEHEIPLSEDDVYVNEGRIVCSCFNPKSNQK